MFSVNKLRVDHPPGLASRATLVAATDSGVWEYSIDPDTALVPVYRFYNIETQGHFYTASSSERDQVLATMPQFTYEGVAFYAANDALAGSLPVYLFFNTQTGVHFYTASEAERDAVAANLPQFVFEGIAFYAFADSEPGTVKLYRFYDAETEVHFYTTQDDERDAVIQHLPGYALEGVACNVYPAGSQQ